MIPYLNLLVYVCLSFVAGFFVLSLHLSTWLLHGLHSYLYPEASSGNARHETHSGSGFKSTTRKESRGSVDGMSTSEGLSKPEQKDYSEDGENVKSNAERPCVILKRRERKKKDKSTDRFSWDEGSSQIYRLTLSHSQLVGRLYFAEYDEVIVYAVVGLANLLAHECLSYIPLSHLAADKSLRKFDIIPFLMGFIAVYKIATVLSRVGWQSSTSRVSELILSISVGFIGFVLALYVLLFAPSSALDFGLEGSLLLRSSSYSDSKRQLGFFFVSPTLSRISVAAVAGFVAGIFVTPAHRSVRSFWLGTDQLHWNIPLAKCGALVRFLLHLNVVLPLIASLFWIKPLGELFVASEASQHEGYNAESEVVGVQIWGKMLFPAPSDDWARDFGISRNLFNAFRFWGLVVAGMLQLCLLRVNIQTYLNEAVIVWYEGLHRSKVMNLELTRAKLLLNSYFLCRVAIQFVVPGMLVALLLGMSRIWGGVPISELAETSPNLLFLKVIVLFMAWWATFSWSILTCVTLALYRAGFLLAS